MSNTKNIRGFMDGLRPIKRTTVDEWSDANVVLTSENSAEPGPFRTDRVPYARDIMRDLSPTSGVTDIIWMKGVQLIATTTALNTLGCFADIDPCGMMYVMPTLDLAKAISTDRFTPMVDNSRRLRRLFKRSGKRDSGNSILKKSLRGGRINFAGANSAPSLRSRPARVLILDEPDAYPLDLSGEGSPIALAEGRQVTYGDRRKTFKLSTPKRKGTSVIEFEYLQTDQRKYFLPCPHCAAAQHLIFANLKWEPKKFNTVYYECEHCHEPIKEIFKTQMLERGEWIATAPENLNPKKKGYHLNSLYSPLGMLSWAEIVEKYEKALLKPELMITFINTILGETYSDDEGDAPQWEALYNRACESYTPGALISDNVAFITCGVDVQRDRIEYEVVGWCNGAVSYSIDYNVIEGDTADRKTWDKLGLLLNQKWTRPDKAQLDIKLMCVDMGYNAGQVYGFCNRHPGGRVIATQGQSLSIPVGTPAQVQVAIGGKKIGAHRVWGVGQDLLKTQLYGCLNLTRGENGEVPEGYCFFPAYAPHYFKMLTAERWVMKVNKKGFLEYVWELPSHTRNEALDCRVYARAGAHVVGLDRMTPAEIEKMRVSYLTKSNDGKKQGGGSPLLEGESFW